MVTVATAQLCCDRVKAAMDNICTHECGWANKTLFIKTGSEWPIVCQPLLCLLILFFFFFKTILLPRAIYSTFSLSFLSCAGFYTCFHGFLLRIHFTTFWNVPSVPICLLRWDSMDLVTKSEAFLPLIFWWKEAVCVVVWLGVSSQMTWF